jgi:predicted nucleotidyltransferase
MHQALIIDGVILFGSTVRKMDRIDSDLDICLVGEKPQLTEADRNCINNIVNQYVLNEEIFINWIYFNVVDWNRAVLPIIKTIKKEGRILWENGKIDWKSQTIIS